MSAETLKLIVPEIILVATGTLLYLVGAFLPTRRTLVNVLALAGVVTAGSMLSCPCTASSESLAGPLSADLFGQYVRMLTLGVGLLFVLMSSKVHETGPGGEYVGTLLMALAGVMLAASAQNLVLLFLGLELVSIPTYVLLYLGRRDVASQESTMKYFFLSILSSAFLLYGFSFLYGIGGSMEFGSIAQALLADDPTGGSLLLGRIALALIVAGLAFRIAAVPFHFYAPDVYQGTTNGNAALLSVLPKIVGFVVLIRLLVTVMPGLESFGWRVAMILSVLTMTIGNVVALWQKNLRRLLAYSSIANAGYMLIGLAGALAEGGDNLMFSGVQAVLVYLVAYSLGVAGTMSVMIYLGRGEDREINTLDDLAGVGRTHPLAGGALAICMFSLAGIPPLAGFWGKLTLVANALSVGGAESSSVYGRWFVILAVISVLNAAVAAAYYLRIVAVAYFGASEKSSEAARGGAGPALAMTLAVVGLLVVGFYPAAIIERAEVAAQAIQRPTIESVQARAELEAPKKEAATSAAMAEVAAAP